jgi:hypothetical protein
LELPENWRFMDDFTGKDRWYLFDDTSAVVLVIEKINAFNSHFRARYGHMFIDRGKEKVWHAFATEEEAVATMLAWLRFKTAEELKE